MVAKGRLVERATQAADGRLLLVVVLREVGNAVCTKLLFPYTDDQELRKRINTS